MINELPMTKRYVITKIFIMYSTLLLYELMHDTFKIVLLYHTISMLTTIVCECGWGRELILSSFLLKLNIRMITLLSHLWIAEFSSLHYAFLKARTIRGSTYVYQEEIFHKVMHV